MQPIGVLIVMGVAGSGKTTIGRLLAERTGWEFKDADDYHSADNVAKMSAGITSRRPTCWSVSCRPVVGAWRVRRSGWLELWAMAISGQSNW